MRHRCPAADGTPAAVRVAATLLDLPAASVPAVGETLSQAEVFTSDQVNGAVPVLVSQNVPEFGVNGPPIGPEQVKPPGAAMTRGLAAPASESMKDCPAGVPQPVHRS